MWSTLIERDVSKAVRRESRSSDNWTKEEPGIAENGGIWRHTRQSGER